MRRPARLGQERWYHCDTQELGSLIPAPCPQLQPAARGDGGEWEEVKNGAARSQVPVGLLLVGDQFPWYLESSGVGGPWLSGQ